MKLSTTAIYIALAGFHLAGAIPPPVAQEGISPISAQAPSTPSSPDEIHSKPLPTPLTPKGNECDPCVPIFHKCVEPGDNSGCTYEELCKNPALPQCGEYPRCEAAQHCQEKDNGDWTLNPDKDPDSGEPIHKAPVVRDRAKDGPECNVCNKAYSACAVDRHDSPGCNLFKMCFDNEFEQCRRPGPCSYHWECVEGADGRFRVIGHHDQGFSTQIGILSKDGMN